MPDMSEDPFLSPEWRDYAERAVKELLPMIEDSACSAILLAGGKPDVKQALELGFSILLDKPIILLVATDAEVPEHLRRAADEIVVGEIQHPKTAKLLSEAVARVVPE